MSKVYHSKSGKRFSITNVNKPSDGEVVFFTQREFDWLKSQNLKQEEFDLVWNLKKENHLYDPVPLEQSEKAQTVADKYAKEIIEMLMHGAKKNKAEIGVE